MKKSRMYFYLASLLLACAGNAYSMVNPFTVLFESGSTNFTPGGSGTANYVVAVNSSLPPAIVLNLSLKNPVTSQGLTATQITTGASPCLNTTTLCGSTFPLSANQSCCLAFSLSSTKADDHSLQPIVGTTPAVYQVQAPSAQAVVVSNSSNVYSVGGTVSGLSGTVVLQNNGTNNTTVNASGSFTFSTAIVQGSNYSVAVFSQPATQTCTLLNASGTNISSNITNVSVTCTTNTYSVGGAVSGLSSTVVLQNNGTNNTTINSSGSFTFSTSVIPSFLVTKKISPESLLLQ